MKICNLFVLLPLMQMAFFAKAVETNKMYFTYGSFSNPSATSGPPVPGIIYSKTKVETNDPREFLPAKDFPEGNWGEPFNGLQLSLRFAKQTYTNGEPI